MSFEWLALSNPVAIWWIFLLIVSALNVALLLLLHRCYRGRMNGHPRGILCIEPLVLLCATYVLGCAFRSVLPRADVQRICLFDTWLSSVVIGRSVATVAEICFAAQWAIVLRQLSRPVKSDAARNISIAIVPLIVLAECCSWYAVVSTNYLGNAIENSLWALTFTLIAAALLRVFHEFRDIMKLAIGSAIAGIVVYVGFLCIVDVPMYFGRWQADVLTGKELLGVLSGFHDVSTRWAVTHDLTHWQDEIAWMSLYFSVAVWSSLVLASFGLIRDGLPLYRVQPAHLLPANLRLSRTKAQATL
jgi:hypothetical protein